MDKKQIATGSIGIVGLISLLISGGLYFTDSGQIENSYICLATGETKIFYQ